MTYIVLIIGVCVGLIIGKEYRNNEVSKFRNVHDKNGNKWRSKPVVRSLWGGTHLDPAEQGREWQTHRRNHRT